MCSLFPDGHFIISRWPTGGWRYNGLRCRLACQLARLSAFVAAGNLHFALPSSAPESWQYRPVAGRRLRLHSSGYRPGGGRITVLICWLKARPLLSYRYLKPLGYSFGGMAWLAWLVVAH